MGSRIECFWLEPVELARSSLRRYQRVLDYTAVTCPGNPMRHHDTSVYIGDVPYPYDPQGILGYGKDDVPHDDPRWPKTCHVCGYAFKDDDNWQHNVSQYFRDARNGKLYTTRNMPPGAMYDAKWWDHPGPDGISLAVVLPPEKTDPEYGQSSVWHPDTPPHNGSAPWTRTGTIPKVTCTPSILTPDYHGFLIDGWLVEC